MAGDEALISAAVAGDEDALTDLLERHGVRVRHALRVDPGWGDMLDLDDVMQVTYLEAFLSIRRFTPTGPDSFTAWLRRIAENNLRDAARGLERDEKHLARPAPGSDSYTTLIARLQGTSTTPSQAARRHEIQEIVETCLKKLPPDYEKVLRLYELEGLSGVEVAERLGARTAQSECCWPAHESICWRCCCRIGTPSAIRRDIGWLLYAQTRWRRRCYQCHTARPTIKPSPSGSAS